MNRFVTATSAAIFIAALAIRAEAHDFCVATPGDLRVAFAAASDGGANQDETNSIYLVAGTYSLADLPDRFLYLNTSPTSGLHLWGGFDAGCAHMSEDAAATVLDGAHMSQVLVVRSALGDVDILNLTVQNGETSQNGAGIAVNDTGSTSGAVYLRNLIVRFNHTTSSEGGLRAFTNSVKPLYFDNNLVFNNSADQSEGAGELFGADTVYARYNTITGNTAPGTAVGGLLCGASPTCVMANNIFWQNSTDDLYLFSDAALYFNDIGATLGPAPSTNVGSLSVDPMFVGAPNYDFHLASGSPLRSASTYLDSSSDNDVEGNPLPQVGRTDLGALIDVTFSDGFEAP
jgi:hypothetical protein